MSRHVQVLAQQPDHVLTAYASRVQDRANSLHARYDMEEQARVPQRSSAIMTVARIADVHEVRTVWVNSWM